MLLHGICVLYYIVCHMLLLWYICCMFLCVILYVSCCVMLYVLHVCVYCCMYCMYVFVVFNKPYFCVLCTLYVCMVFYTFIYPFYLFITLSLHFLCNRFRLLLISPHPVTNLLQQAFYVILYTVCQGHTVLPSTHQVHK